MGRLSKASLMIIRCGERTFVEVGSNHTSLREALIKLLYATRRPPGLTIGLDGDARMVVNYHWDAIRQY